MTYVVLVILIALWAVVLVPPYLKDRRATSNSYRSMARGGSLPGVSGAQRFMPLQHAGPAVHAPALGAHRQPAVSVMASAPAASTGSGGNVVHLRPAGEEPAVLGPIGDESTLQAAWEPTRPSVRATPTTTAAARERRRHVLIGLTGAAFVTLLAAMAFGGAFIAIHVALDAALLGYVILLVRHRQIVAERRSKVEPIRPAVSEQPPATLQAAPSYLLRSGTGS